MKNILCLAFLLWSVAAGAQSGFNYQGVLRNAAGELMANASIDLRFRLMRDTTLSDQFEFEEVHQVSTNNFGVFSVVVGTTDPEKIKSMDYSATYFMEVALRPISQSFFVVLNRSQLSSVPNAMHAVTVENPDDADPDPTNEMQMLSFDTVNNMLQISGGNAIQIPASRGDADADPENELQQISKVGNRIRLSDGGEIIDDDTDDDSDPENELQQISKDGNIIKLSDGGEVFDEVMDEDADPENELQTISLSGSRLQLSKTRSSVDLSHFKSPWKREANDVINYDGTTKSSRIHTNFIQAPIKSPRGFSSWIELKDHSEITIIPENVRVLNLTKDGANILGNTVMYNHLTVGASNNPNQPKMRIIHGADASLSKDGYLILGQTSGDNIVMDNNEIIARRNGGRSTLHLQNEGGNLIISENGKGKVGIQTAPTHELHIKHGGSSNGSAGIKIENNGSNKNWWSLYTANGSGQFEFYHKGVIKGRILPSDGSYVKSSDIRLKHDVQTVGPILDKIKSLAPKTYLFNDQPHAPNRSIGFIAQEVKELFPNLVQHNPSDEHKFLSLNYDGFSVLAIRAIQEQQDLIDQQQTELRLLKADIKDLEEQFSTLITILKSSKNANN